MSNKVAYFQPLEKSRQVVTLSSFRQASFRSPDACIHPLAGEVTIPAIFSSLLLPMDFKATDPIHVTNLGERSCAAFSMLKIQAVKWSFTTCSETSACPAVPGLSLQLTDIQNSLLPWVVLFLTCYSLCWKTAADVMDLLQHYCCSFAYGSLLFAGGKQAENRAEVTQDFWLW